MTKPSRWLSDAYFGPAPVAAGLMLAVAAVAYAWRLLAGHLSYPDPVAGLAALGDVDKAIDFKALAVLFAVTAAAALAYGRAFRGVAPDGPASPTGRALTGLLLLSLIPAGWRLAIAAVHAGGNTIPPFRLMAAGPAVALAVAAGLCRYRPGSVRPGDVYACGGAVLLSAFFAALAAVGAMVAAGRLSPDQRVLGRVGDWLTPAVSAAVAAAGVAAVVCWARSADVDVLRVRLLRCLVWSQVAVPLTLFYLVPPPLMDPLHRFATPRPYLLWATLAALVVGCGWTVVRRLRGPAGSTLAWAVAPATAVALLVFGDCPAAYQPEALGDMFHWGEQVLPWQQIVDFHRRPYVDFVPIHGIMPLLREGMNALFFTGTASTFSAGDTLLQALACAAAAWAACRLVGPVAALLLLLAPLPELDRLYLLAPALYLTAAPSTWRRPAAGLVAWLGLCLLMAAYNGAIGPAFALGTAPVALWAAWRAGWRRCLGVAAGVAAVVAVGAAVAPVRATAVGYLRFVNDSRWTNTVANDIPWADGAWQRLERVGLGTGQTLWEVERFAWVGVVVLAAGLAWRALGRRDAGDAGQESPAGGREGPAGGRPGLVPLAVGTALVLTCVAPWTMGRIDPAYMSRPGAVSHLALFYLVPFLLLLARPGPRTALAAAVLVGLVYPSELTFLDPVVIGARTTGMRYTPADRRMVDGAVVGLPRLGQVLAPQPSDWLDGVIQLRRDLGRFLRPGETYLDLTDEQALYYFMDLPVPAPYPSYVAANGRLQAAEMQVLADHPVPAVMVGPPSGFDGNTVPLRCYRPYRDYVTRYEPARVGPFTFLVDPARPWPGAARPASPEARLEMLDDVFRPTDLRRMPMAWGRSWPTLRGRFTVVGDGAVTPDRIAVPPVVADGTDADFVLLHVTTPGEPKLALQWAAAADPWGPNPALFRGHTGDLLVPLGAYPRWLLGHPRSVRVTATDGFPVRVDRATFLRLDPL